MKNAPLHSSAEKGPFHKTQPSITTEHLAHASQRNIKLGIEANAQLIINRLANPRAKPLIGKKLNRYKKPSLRGAINQNCKQCIVDSCSPGSWRQQVTLCSVENCPLWQVRPQTTCPIPESVLQWYGAVKGGFEQQERDIDEDAT